MSVLSSVEKAMGSALDFLIGGMQKQSAPSSDQAQLYDDIVSISQMIQWITQVLGGLWDELLLGMSGESQKIFNTGAAYGNIGVEWSEAMLRLTDYVIPQSLKWVEGDIERRLIEPLRSGQGGTNNRITQLFADLTALKKRVSILEEWRKKIVDPTLNEYRSFKATFVSTYLPTITRTAAYYAAPKTLVDWLVPISVDAMAKAMGDNADHASESYMNAQYVSEWPNMLSTIDAALLGLMQAPIPAGWN